MLDLGNGTTLTSLGEENAFSDIFYKFPMNYGDMFDNNWLIEENYSLTAPAFGLSDAPVSRIFSNEDKVEVVGWGKLVLPQDGIADSLEVLLVKTSYTNVTNYFLNGSTAPSALTNALGLQEGETSSAVVYEFISKEYGNVVALNFDVGSNGTLTSKTAYYVTSKTE